jgi:hypothetical protein
MIHHLLDWLDASVVQPPAGYSTQGVLLNCSETVMLKQDDGTHVYGYAIYEEGRFKKWSAMGNITDWAYYN